MELILLMVQISGEKSQEKEERRCKRAETVGENQRVVSKYVQVPVHANGQKQLVGIKWWFQSTYKYQYIQ